MGARHCSMALPLMKCLRLKSRVVRRFLRSRPPVRGHQRALGLVPFRHGWPTCKAGERLKQKAILKVSYIVAVVGKDGGHVKLLPQEKGDR